ncbi:MAG: hypothetical protein RR523_04755 [Cetobacterium sp.]|uniref:hypothetical protein n=1 Tax=Cetobacterium sp. TaxID=2071632 RepID=UPI002FC86E5A
MIKLNPREKYYLDGKFFLIRKGKVITKDILPNGKIISNENCLREGEIIGNFFNFLKCEYLSVPEIDIEVEALEKSILEEFNFSQLDIVGNVIFEKMLSQLIKKSTIKFLYQLYDKKGYILAILKLYANSEGRIPKKEINYENFNISKSQFYALFSKLKQEKFLEEEKNEIILDVNKIDSFLNLFEFN